MSLIKPAVVTSVKSVFVVNELIKIKKIIILKEAHRGPPQAS